MPSANKWDLAEIMNCLDAHEQAQRLMKSKAKIMIEYVMLQVLVLVCWLWLTCRCGTGS